MVAGVVGGARWGLVFVLVYGVNVSYVWCLGCLCLHGFELIWVGILVWLILVYFSTGLRCSGFL